MAQAQLKPKILSFLDDVSALRNSLLYYIGKEPGITDLRARTAERELRATLDEMRKAGVEIYYIAAALFASLRGDFNQVDRHLQDHLQQHGPTPIWLAASFDLRANAMQAVKLNKLANDYGDFLLQQPDLIRPPVVPLITGLFQFYLKAMPTLRNLYPDNAPDYDAMEAAADLFRDLGTTDEQLARCLNIVGDVLLEAGIFGISKNIETMFTTEPNTFHIHYRIDHPLDDLSALHKKMIDRLIDAELDDIGLIIDFIPTHAH